MRGRPKRSAPNEHAEGEEDGAFLKKLRAVQDEALADLERTAREAAAKARQELEQAVPAPPPITAAESAELMVAIEAKILDETRKNPTRPWVAIDLVEKKLMAHIPCAFDGSGWWAHGCIVTNPTRVNRFEELLQACMGWIIDIWNVAHPEFEARFVHERLLVDIPKRE